MKVKVEYIIAITAIVAYGCSGSGTNNTTEVAEIEKDTTEKGLVTYIDLTDPLDEAQIAEGLSIFEQRCDNCHLLDTTKLVGPGWAGITNRRSPEWIVNMILNVNIMVKEDSTAHQLLKENKIQMPNQNLAVDKARSVLEFMRKNDLDQTNTKDQGDTKTVN